MKLSQESLTRTLFYQAYNQLLLTLEAIGINTRTKIEIAALFVVCILTTGILSAFYYNSVIHEKDNQITTLKTRVAELQTQVDQLNEQIAQLKIEIEEKNSQIGELTNQLNSLNSQVTALNSQIADLNAQIAQLTYEADRPNLVLDNLVVEDDRSSIPYNFHVKCRVNNTGGRTAYNAYLQVGAANEADIVID
jgi:septal ring factor EnvC (AmiA/AmiB activator)